MITSTRIGFFLLLTGFSSSLWAKEPTDYEHLTQLFMTHCYEANRLNDTSKRPETDLWLQLNESEAQQLNFETEASSEHYYHLDETRNAHIILSINEKVVDEINTHHCRITYSGGISAKDIKKNLKARFGTKGTTGHVGRSVDFVKGWSQYAWSNNLKLDDSDWRLQESYIFVNTPNFYHSRQLVTVQFKYDKKKKNQAILSFDRSFKVDEEQSD